MIVLQEGCQYNLLKTGRCCYKQSGKLNV